MIKLDHKLLSLKADAGDRFEGKKYVYANGKPITRLRYLGALASMHYYADPTEPDARMPLPPAAPRPEPIATSEPVAIGGKLGGRKL